MKPAATLHPQDRGDERKQIDLSKERRCIAAHRINRNCLTEQRSHPLLWYVIIVISYVMMTWHRLWLDSLDAICRPVRMKFE